MELYQWVFEMSWNVVGLVMGVVVVFSWVPRYVARLGRVPLLLHFPLITSSRYRYHFNTNILASELDCLSDALYTDRGDRCQGTPYLTASLRYILVIMSNIQRVSRAGCANARM
jgi:predicted LPLAT superfamily acyltransferase